MIVSFKHKGLMRFAKTGIVKGILPNHAARLRKCLKILDNAHEVKRLIGRIAHPMTEGSPLSGCWAMKVSKQWRLVFEVGKQGDCYLVDYRNYH